MPPARQRILLALALSGLAGCGQRNEVEAKAERVLGIDVPSEFEAHTMDLFAGPGDFVERYDLVFTPEAFSTLTGRLDLGRWKRTPTGSNYELSTAVDGHEVLLYLKPSERTLLYVWPDR